MIKNLLFICLTFFSYCSIAQNFVATYGFANVTTNSGTIDPGAVPLVNGLTFGSFLASGSSSNPSASGRFSFTNWPLGGVNGTDDYSNFTGALSPTVYYEVSINVNPGYTLNLNALAFDMRRSGTGIRNYVVRSNLDNYTNNLAASTGTATRLSVLPGNVFFWNYDSVSVSSDQKGSALTLGAEFDTITTSVTFRFFAWNAESSGGSFSVENVSFTGSATNTLTLPDLVGLAPLSEIETIKLYPNPSKDGKVLIENANALRYLEIRAISGALISVINVNDYVSPLALDLSYLENGMYYLKMHSEKKKTLTRIFVLNK